MKNFLNDEFWLERGDCGIVFGEGITEKSGEFVIFSDKLFGRFNWVLKSYIIDFKYQGE